MHVRRAPAFLAALLLLALAAHAADTWKVAPPPPASWDRDRVADLTARRKAVMAALGDKAILILYAAEPRNYAGDVDWPYRQENNFFYLTGISQAGSTLVLIPGAARVREILFLPPSNPSRETWTGHILTPAEGRAISGIQEIWDARRVGDFLAAVMPPRAAAILTPPPPPPLTGSAARNVIPLPQPPAIPVNLKTEFPGNYELHMMTQPVEEFDREKKMADALAALQPSIKVKQATPVFNKAREIKSQREIDLLQHAIDITSEAFNRVMAVAAPGVPEYEIQAHFEFTFLRRNAHWGYPCIVGAGDNATTLHYMHNKDTLKPGELLLMDDAAEFDGYSADVTRTIPISGKFSRAQADIYRLVYDAQQAGIQATLPGRQLRTGSKSVEEAAIEVFKKGLYRLGLITDPNSEQQVRIWFNHGIGHGIGLNVHDETSRELAPGMVVTVEPGLYIRPDALDNLPKTPENEKFIAAVKPAFEKYKGIGVRIEDDVMVTTGQPKVMSSAVPSRLEDVEAAVDRARKLVKTVPLP